VSRPAAETAWPARAAAFVLLALGFLPWAALVDTGLEMPALGAQLRDWASGSALAAGVGLLAWMASRRGHWPAAGATVPTGTPHLPRTVYLVAFCAFILYIVVAWTVFSGRPLLIDEVAQLWQGHRYAEGRLWLPVPAHREFFSFLHLVDVGDRVYAQFPPGGPFMLALGVAADAPWLVGPLCGALMVVLFARVARAAESDASARWVSGAAALFAAAPFAVFMFASHMNHVTALVWILAAVVALAALTQAESPRVHGWTAVALGFSLGAAATIRPLDAFAFALPAAIWLLARTRSSRARWIEIVVAGCGVAVPFAAMMFVNTQTTGHPLRFGYEVLWGTSHGLGFHDAPWGEPHTPFRGLALASLYQWRLQSYLFETPFPSLLLPVIALAGWRRVGALDRYLLAAGALIVAFYLLYWHDGFYLGPRFVLPLLPVLVLWTARLPRLIGERVTSVHVRRAATAVLVFGAVGALIFNLPVRVASYRAGLTSMRTDYAAAAAGAGARDALVFVRESWGAQLVARLWALGVSRPMTEAVYRGTDSCHLDQELTRLEAEGARGAAAERRLAVLLAADSAHVEKSTLTPDPTERVRPGATYTAVCLQRIADDRAGFLHYAPLRLVTSGGNVYARDLHARDSLLLAEYPERPVYLLTRAGTRVDAPLVFRRLGRDSLLAAWRSARP
jgi:hypothetical protein